MVTSYQRIRHVCVMAAVVVLVAVIAVCAYFALHRLGEVRSEAQKATWLAHNAPPGSYRVLELGLQRHDLSAESVWVTQAGAPDAFIDLIHSDQRVDATGQAVRARIDNREASAASIGIGADAVGRSYLLDYVRAGWPVSVSLLAAVLLIVLRRRRQDLDLAAVGAVHLS